MTHACGWQAAQDTGSAAAKNTAAAFSKLSVAARAQYSKAMQNDKASPLVLNLLVICAAIGILVGFFIGLQIIAAAS